MGGPHFNSAAAPERGREGTIRDFARTPRGAQPGPGRRPLSAALLAALALFATAANAADSFAPAGAKATLTVEYVYESSGRKSSEGMYDPYEWRARRTATISANLVAAAPTTLPAMQALEAGQTADIKNKQAKVKSATTKMEPMMADVQKIMEKCGEDEACITRETQKMGEAMSGTPKMDAAMSARKDIEEASKTGPPRYQDWHAVSQKGTYLIDETSHASITDPICMGKPRHRCTRDEVRKGSGEIPAPPGTKTGAAPASGAVEVDTVKSSMTLTLPVPMYPLSYTETITTDEPEGTHDTPTPKGPQKKQMMLRVGPSGSTQDKPLTVPLKGGWRSQSGEETFMLKGDFGDAGKLTVRWRFTAQ